MLKVSIEEKSLINSEDDTERFRVVHETFYAGNVHSRKTSNKKEFLPTPFVSGTFVLQ